MANDNLLGDRVIRGVDGSGNQKNIRTDSAGNLTTTTGTAARPSTGALTSVASSAASVTVLPTNANRLGATISNDSTSALNLLLVTGGTASASVFTVRLGPKGTVPDYYEVPFGYTGDVIGIWDSANGNARVTEFTA